MLMCAHAYGQQANWVMAGSGVRLVASGTVNMNLRQGNWVNNASATAFTPGTGTVLFTGNTAASEVSGSFSTTFYNLTVNKTGQELQLLTAASVSGTASLAAGNLNLGNVTLDLGTTGTLSGESYPNGNRAYCIDNNTGRIRVQRTLAAGANTDIAGLGLDLDVTGAAPGSTVFFRGHDRQTSTAFAGAGTSIGRYYDITPTVTTGFTYRFLFRYHDQELAGMPESNFVFYRSPSYAANTADWQEWGAGNGPLSPGYPTVGLATHNTAANTVSLSGINTFSRWTLSNSVVSPLPITLLAFTAVCEDGSVRLAWTTASEINNEKFTVHRSADLQTWEEVATQPGAGNSNTPITYVSVDARPLNGQAYYRLTQRDYDGTAESFVPVSVVCYPGQAGNAMSVYPNPASDRFTVSVGMAYALPGATLEISDMNGKRIIQQNVNLAEGTNEFTFDRGGMAPGTYVVSVSAPALTLKPMKLIVR